jgi:hypothetical protein
MRKTKRTLIDIKPIMIFKVSTRSIELFILSFSVPLKNSKCESKRHKSKRKNVYGGKLNLKQNLYIPNFLF